MSQTWVALLRGVNVGGRHKLPMADLRAIASEAGGERVRSYIQSGNLLFDAPTDTVRSVVGRTEDAVEQRLGFRAAIGHRARSFPGRQPVRVRGRS